MTTTRTTERQSSHPRLHTDQRRAGPRNRASTFARRASFRAATVPNCTSSPSPSPPKLTWRSRARSCGEGLVKKTSGSATSGDRGIRSSAGSESETRIDPPVPVVSALVEKDPVEVRAIAPLPRIGIPPSLSRRKDCTVITRSGDIGGVDTCANEDGALACAETWGVDEEDDATAGPALPCSSPPEAPLPTGSPSALARIRGCRCHISDSRASASSDALGSVLAGGADAPGFDTDAAADEAGDTGKGATSGIRAGPERTGARMAGSAPVRDGDRRPWRPTAAVVVPRRGDAVAGVVRAATAGVATICRSGNLAETHSGETGSGKPTSTSEDMEDVRGGDAKRRDGARDSAPCSEEATDPVSDAAWPACHGSIPVLAAAVFVGPSVGIVGEGVGIGVLMVAGADIVAGATNVVVDASAAGVGRSRPLVSASVSADLDSVWVVE